MSKSETCVKAMKAAQAASRGRRNKGKAIIKLKDEEEVIIIAPGEYGVWGCDRERGGGSVRFVVVATAV